MRLNTLLALTAILAGSLAVGMIARPDIVLALIGRPAEPGARVIAQLFGTEQAAHSLLAWQARTLGDARARRAIALAFAVAAGLGLITAGAAAMGGALNAVGWAIGALYAFFAAGYPYCLWSEGLAHRQQAKPATQA